MTDIVVNINYVAVLVATIAGMGIGYVWYSPFLFAKQWMKAIGKSEEQLKKEAAANPYMYPLMFVSNLVMAYVLAHFVIYTQSTTFTEGMQAGFWIWLGFVVTVALTDVLFEGKKRELYFLKIGYFLVTLLVMGGILATWQ